MQVSVALGAGLQKKEGESHGLNKFGRSRTGDKIADATIAGVTG